jgi:hypothetical protein
VADWAPVIVSPEESPEPGSGVRHPRAPFWDLSAPGVYVQFDERLLTAWERVSIAGIDLPGRCAVVSPGRARKVQRNSGPGDETETLIDTGALAADVQIIVQIWTPEHLARWEEFSEKMRDLVADARDDTGAKSASAPALDIVHPGLNMAGVASLYVYQVSVLQPGAVRGTMESTILATEYRQIKKAKNQALPQVTASKANLVLAPEMERAAVPTPSSTEGGP